LLLRDATRAATYDFRQAHSLSADQLRELQEHCSNLCRALQRYVPESTGLPAKLALEQLQLQTYDEFFDELPELPIITLCEFVPNALPVLWQIDAAPVFAYMDAMLGGDGIGLNTAQRELTLLERALVAEIVEEFISTWKDAWPALDATAARVIEVRQTTGRFAAAALAEAMVAARVAITVAEESGVMRIAFPSVAIKALIKQSGGTGPVRHQGEHEDISGLQRLAPCQITVTVRLGGAHMTLRQFQTLKPGDVVPLDRGPRDMLDVLVAGKLKFKGVSGLANGHLGIRLVEPVSTE
jgi:flagellar motor switch protein FliM